MTQIWTGTRGGRDRGWTGTGGGRGPGVDGDPGWTAARGGRGPEWTRPGMDGDPGWARVRSGRRRDGRRAGVGAGPEWTAAGWTRSGMEAAWDGGGLGRRRPGTDGGWGWVVVGVEGRAGKRRQRPAMAALSLRHDESPPEKSIIEPERTPGGGGVRQAGARHGRHARHGHVWHGRGAGDG